MKITCSVICDAILRYETEKVIHIKSKKIGPICRYIQLVVIIYVIGWVLIKDKGYQIFDDAVSGVTAKLKGVSFSNITNNKSIVATVWDAADYVIPPQQNAAFFVMTGVVFTPEQVLDRCEDSNDVFINSCNSDTDCLSGKLGAHHRGVQTGKCVKSTKRLNQRVCEIYSWCPVEEDEIIGDEFKLKSVPNFTVMIKNSIEFPLFEVKRRNILPWMDKKYLKTCQYNQKDERSKFCPIFKISDILKYAKADAKELYNFGGKIGIQIEWNCNLDFSEEHCLPYYTFTYLEGYPNPIEKGWNFNYGHQFMKGGIHKRTLIRAYGIQFFISVYGKGGRFDLLTLSMNLGSGLALMIIASIVCDFILLNLSKHKSIYRCAKFDSPKNQVIANGICVKNITYKIEEC